MKTWDQNGQWHLILRTSAHIIIGKVVEYHWEVTYSFMTLNILAPSNLTDIFVSVETGWHWTPGGLALKRGTFDWRDLADKARETSRSWTGICSSRLWVWPQTRAFCTQQTAEFSALIHISQWPSFRGMIQILLPNELLHDLSLWKDFGLLYLQN